MQCLLGPTNKYKRSPQKLGSCQENKEALQAVYDLNQVSLLILLSKPSITSSCVYYGCCMPVLLDRMTSGGCKNVINHTPGFLNTKIQSYKADTE